MDRLEFRSILHQIMREKGGKINKGIIYFFIPGYIVVIKEEKSAFSDDEYYINYGIDLNENNEIRYPLYYKCQITSRFIQSEGNKDGFVLSELNEEQLIKILENEFASKITVLMKKGMEIYLERYPYMWKLMRKELKEYLLKR